MGPGLNASPVVKVYLLMVLSAFFLLLLSPFAISWRLIKDKYSLDPSHQLEEAKILQPRDTNCRLECDYTRTGAPSCADLLIDRPASTGIPSAVECGGLQAQINKRDSPKVRFYDIFGNTC